MDRLDAMALFVSAVQGGSLAAAARRHGRSAAAVTRAIALLERYAGETLMLRSTRKLSLTPAGERRLATWQDVLVQLREIEPADPRSLKGGVVLTAPELFGRLKVMPVLEEFLRQHREVTARVLMLNRIVDLLGEGIDVAVRLAPLPDSTLTAIKLGELRTLLCAAPEYLDRAGTLATPADLAGHDCIGLNAEGDGELWSFAAAPLPASQVRSVRVHTRLSVNNAAAALEAALRGQGVVRVRSYQVADHIAAGRLTRLLPDFEPPASPAHLVFHPDRGRTAMLRTVIDYLVPQLRRRIVDVETALHG